MNTASNELDASAFVTAPHVDLVPSVFQFAGLASSITGSMVRYDVRAAVGTPVPRRAKALTVLSIARDTAMLDWRLKSVLLVQVHSTRRESLATVWLEGFAEYGTGRHRDEAIADLVVSLGEYREALEGREDSLGDSAKAELDCLRRLIERDPAGLASP